MDINFCYGYYFNLFSGYVSLNSRPFQFDSLQIQLIFMIHYCRICVYVPMIAQLLTKLLRDPKLDTEMKMESI